MWTKYSGMKPFERLKVIHIEISGVFWSTYEVEIDFESLTLKYITRLTGGFEEVYTISIERRESRLVSVRVFYV